ncbi:glycine cleavage system protein H [Paraconexibacter antarcticus]|uniref:Glycine cleavage system protein H n=1 Tax=Paraconexibacter antarcticus TaxID=2949664 RepID=A0ABY5DYW2_9ACTN|nr:glycine cleavage system protein H [Paraconexibacter antarcticus]UTI66881.1 glycine cleavage system protein H [Paraconexibacter antarcticus]
MIEIAGYELRLDRLYDPATHMWVQLQEGCRARIGLDPLSSETSGDVVALSLVEPGTIVAQGESVGDLEAAKFVGPLVSPVTGTVDEVNRDVLLEPALLNRDPATNWLVTVALDPSTRHELDAFLSGAEQLRPWFTVEVDRFRTQGAIAE